MIKRRRITLFTYTSNYECLRIDYNINTENVSSNLYYTNKEKMKMNEQKHYIINKKNFNSLKINGCAICGYKKCTASLVFHHVNPEDKKFNVNLGSMHISVERTLTELNKCILLCKNCHAEIHNKELK